MARGQRRPRRRCPRRRGGGAVCRTTQGPLYSVPSRASDKFPMTERQKVGRVGKEKASAINMQKHRKGDGDLELIWSRSPIDDICPTIRRRSMSRCGRLGCKACRTPALVCTFSCLLPSRTEPRVCGNKIPVYAQ